MLNIGISSCGFELTKQNFESLKSAGITHIEISRSWSEYDDMNFEEIKRLAHKYGITLWSLHLPFANPENVDASSLDEKIRQNTVKWWCSLIEKGAAIGIKIFVLHPSCGAKSLDHKIRINHMAASKKSLKELAEFAEEKGVVIAVENQPRSSLSRSVEALAELVSADDRLRVCFDTNHLAGGDNLSLLEKLGDKIITIHVSDYDFTDEKHWLPGEGKNDWQKIYKTLIQKGYTGPWLYELNLTPSKAWYVERKRPLTFPDFYDNATQIFENKPFELKDI